MSDRAAGNSVAGGMVLVEDDDGVVEFVAVVSAELDVTSGGDDGGEAPNSVVPVGVSEHPARTTTAMVKQDHRADIALITTCDVLQLEMVHSRCDLIDASTNSQRLGGTTGPTTLQWPRAQEVPISVPRGLRLHAERMISSYIILGAGSIRLRRSQHFVAVLAVGTEVWR